MPVVKADHIDATAPPVRGQLFPVHTTTGRASRYQCCLMVTLSTDRVTVSGPAEPDM